MISTASFLAFALLGCNAILDNERGVPLETDEAGVFPLPDETPAPKPNEKDAGETPASGCAAGEQLCFGACVSITDPVYGCGDPSCSPCASMHGAMRCEGRTCKVATCEPGYADCNGAGGDGCETDLSKAASCGACNAVCAAAAPQCSPAGPGFQCTNGCSGASPLNCGSECVDPTTSVNHCGGCNHACPAVANATSACTLGLCSFKCAAQFHACSGACAANTDPTKCGPACTACPVPAGGTATCVADTCGFACTAPNRACHGACTAPTDPGACGPACTVCPAPANATATCAADACGFACKAGFGNCDANAANGCEAVFASDPLNCGACGVSCGARACVAGACAP